jgi:hypothetical protein
MTATIDLYHGHHAFELLPVEFVTGWTADRDAAGRRVVEMTATIARAQIGLKWFTRAALVEIVGADEVARAERYVTDNLTLEDAA